MSFWRHGEIYPRDEGTIARPCPRPSRWMSLQPVIPGGLLSSRAHVRFTGRRHARSATGLNAMQNQQTVNCDLSGCLSAGVHRTPHWRKKVLASFRLWEVAEVPQPKFSFRSQSLGFRPDFR
jgi:hypothetical protein